MPLTKQDLAILCAPFTAAEHEFHRGFVYIAEAGITARIEEVDPAWELSANWITVRGDAVTAHVTMVINGTRRDGIGMANQEYSSKATPPKPIGEPEKSAATDAMKRAARLFGIGRYLLTAPEGLNDTTLRKWLTQITPRPADNIPRPPAAQAEVEPAPLIQIELTTVSREVDKQNRDYYRFNGGAYSYSRNPFIQAEYDDAMNWEAYPQSEQFALSGLTANCERRSDTALEVVSVVRHE